MLTQSDVRDKVVGVDREVPLINGTCRSYVNFDNAATTPAFKSVLNKVNEFSEWYGSVHRGTGFKSLLSTHIYDKCRQKVLQFVGGNEEDHTVIFTSNTTHALNKLCNQIDVGDDEVVLTTMTEHHSNMLPWRIKCHAEYIDVFDNDGTFNIERFKRTLDETKKKIKLVAITGASNVTGSMPPLREVSRIVHSYGAEFLVDAAQLISCRPINMMPLSEHERIDYIVFSAHKIYAPFGVGVLVAPHKTFEGGEPDIVGGGTVDVVTFDDVTWTTAPEKEEAGSPNLVGVVALIEALNVMRDMGCEYLLDNCRRLVKRLLHGLNSIPEITVYGTKDCDSGEDRGSVVSFNMDGMPHGLLAAILGYEWGIGVRNGCFCAHPCVAKLLGISSEVFNHVADMIRKGDWTAVPGMVRVSFGVYNTEDEIDYFINALQEIVANGPQVRYTINPQTGEYSPEENAIDFDSYFSL
ncbi:aminotransferase class V-fold PLP-dependent enzyme [Desulfosarcina sp.]|nr:aminotransferase class V-fold PLP-dependent enzyme [Desulfosarcina sp.]